MTFRQAEPISSIFACTWVTGILMLAGLAMTSNLAAQSAFAGEACEGLGRPAPTARQRWQEDKLRELLTCTNSARATGQACNIFVGHAIKHLFGVDEFRATASGGYLPANTIAAQVSVQKSNGWTKVGGATDQSALTRAQSLANSGAMVVAVKTGVAHGHVALVLAGTTLSPIDPHSPWRLLATPNAASAFLGNESAAFVGCPLHYVWKAGPEGVELYSKVPSK